MGTTGTSAVALAGVLTALTACANDEADAEPVVIEMDVGATPGNSEVGGFAYKGEPIVTPGPTLELRVGVPVTLHVENVHRGYPHNLVIVADEESIDGEPLWGAVAGFAPEDEPDAAHQERELWWEEGVGTVTFTPDQPGTYLYVCSIPGHPARGMSGTVIVTS